MPEAYRPKGLSSAVCYQDAKAAFRWPSGGGMSGYGTKQTLMPTMSMSASGGKADIPDTRHQCPLMTQSRHRRKPAKDRNGHGLSFGRMQPVGFLQSERPAELSVLAVARDS